MAEPIESIRRLPRLSLSTISDTTVNSSLENRITVENAVSATNNYAVENYVRNLNGEAQNTFRIEGSSGIRVGDAIYNIYYPPKEDRKKSRRRSSSIKSETQTNENIKCDKSKFWNLWKIKIIGSILLLIVSVVIGYVLFLILKKSPDPMNETAYIIPRSEWTSDPVNTEIKFLSIFPIRRIIVGQTDDTDSCFNKSDCLSRLRKIRSDHPTLLDIPWNFLIGADGNVYEGRGYKYEGEHTINVNASDYNDIGIGIGFIGNFSAIHPPDAMTNVLHKFILHSVRDGNFSTEYKIFLQDQLMFKEFEATGLKNALKGMFDEKVYGIQKIYTRKEWGGAASCNILTSMKNPLDRVILHHTATAACYEQNCTKALQVLQKNAIEGCKFIDINYNFILGGWNNFSIVMEGRGFSKLGAHTALTNTGSLGIGLIGNYNEYAPDPAMMTALQVFINDSVALGKLKENYLLHIKKDFGSSSSPGTYVINIVKNWPKFSKP